MGVRIAVSTEPDEAAVTAVDGGLRVHNAPFLPEGEAEPLWVLARDDDGAVVAGLKGSTMWGWLYIDQLWVEDGHRGQGLGGALLAGAERAAKGRGCTGAHLHSFSFQAPDFYGKRGYQQAGRIANLPAGHEWVWLSKTL